MTICIIFIVKIFSINTFFFFITIFQDSSTYNKIFYYFINTTIFILIDLFDYCLSCLFYFPFLFCKVYIYDNGIVSQLDWELIKRRTLSQNTQESNCNWVYCWLTLQSLTQSFPRERIRTCEQKLTPNLLVFPLFSKG